MVALGVALTSGAAQADVPPPPGQTRVAYEFRVDNIPDGVALVAFAAYNSKLKNGHFVLLAANQDSHTVVVFKVNPETGTLTPTGGRVEVGSPVCIKFLTLTP